MKWEFNLTLLGNKSFEEKFEDYTKNKYALHGDLITSFALLVKVALGLDGSDLIGIDNFIARRVQETSEVIQNHGPQVAEKPEMTAQEAENYAVCDNMKKTPCCQKTVV